MSRLSNKWVLIAVTFVALFALQAPASAIPVTVNVAEIAGTTQSVIGLTGFSTDGSDMAGMLVTAFFRDGESASGVWAAVGPGAGHASGSTVDARGNPLSFDLSQGGDTFSNVWALTNLSSASSESALTRILIDGFPGDTVFDRTFGGVFGTEGSFFGADFSSTSQYDFQLDILATYIDQVAISGFGPVGDVFRYLDIDLGGGFFGGDPALAFLADTDSIGLPPGQTPEPGSTLLLLGAGLIALYRRRRG